MSPGVRGNDDQTEGRTVDPTALAAYGVEPKNEVALLGSRLERLACVVAIRLAEVLLHPPDDVMAYGVLRLERRKVARLHDNLPLNLVGT
jgi:hypothetical protein